METLVIKTKTKEDFKAIQNYALSMNLEVIFSETNNDMALGLLMEEHRKAPFLGVENSKEFIQKMANELRYK